MNCSRRILQIFLAKKLPVIRLWLENLDLACIQASMYSIHNILRSDTSTKHDITFDVSWSETMKLFALCTYTYRMNQCMKVLR